LLAGVHRALLASAPPPTAPAPPTAPTPSAVPTAAPVAEQSPELKQLQDLCRAARSGDNFDNMKEELARFKALADVNRMAMASLETPEKAAAYFANIKAATGVEVTQEQKQALLNKLEAEKKALSSLQNQYFDRFNALNDSSITAQIVRGQLDEIKIAGGVSLAMAQRTINGVVTPAAPTPSRTFTGAAAPTSTPTPTAAPASQAEPSAKLPEVTVLPPLQTKKTSATPPPKTSEPIIIDVVAEIVEPPAETPPQESAPAATAPKETFLPEELAFLVKRVAVLKTGANSSYISDGQKVRLEVLWKTHLKALDQKTPGNDEDAKTVADLRQSLQEIGETLYPSAASAGPSTSIIVAGEAKQANEPSPIKPTLALPYRERRMGKAPSPSSETVIELGTKSHNVIQETQDFIESIKAAKSRFDGKTLTQEFLAQIPEEGQTAAQKIKELQQSTNHLRRHVNKIFQGDKTEYSQNLLEELNKGLDEVEQFTKDLIKVTPGKGGLISYKKRSLIPPPSTPSP
jgi:hypothetical protein